MTSMSSAATTRRSYVIDTSVLLSDPQALRRFAEHDVVLPVVVITELEAKRHHSELGYFARTALRLLDDLRIAYGRLDAPIPVNDQGGTVHVELNHTDPEVLPAGFRLGDNDSRILSVALNYAAEGHDVTLVSKDLPMRVKASAVGLAAEEYRAELAADPEWTGMAEVEVSSSDLDRLYEQGTIDLHEVRELPCHTGVVLNSGSGSALGRVTPAKELKLVTGGPGRFRNPWPIGRAAGGARPAAGPDHRHRLPRRPGRHRQVGAGALCRAGGGAGAPAARQGGGLPAACTRWAVRSSATCPAPRGRRWRPGRRRCSTPWARSTSKDVIDEVVERGLLEVLPLTHIRGRSLHDAFVIVDEAQSLERNVLLTVLSRIGQDSRVVLTHDVAQRDNLRVGRHDGVVAVVEKLKGHPLFAHVTLHRSERSPIAALVTEMLEDVAS